MFKVLITALAVLLMAGCVSEHLPPPPPASDPAQTKLAEAAVSVSNSIGTLEGIRKSENPDYAKNLPVTRCMSIQSRASVDWTGPIGPLVAKLAKAGDYHYRALGYPPAIPIIVQLHKKYVPVGELLRDADYQAGKKAYIICNQHRRLVELRYRSSP